MSKISLQPNASGAGTFSIVAPDSNINRTLTLPDEAGEIVTSASSDLVPAGALMYFTMNTPPTGWLKANGAAISRTTFSALFNAIGTTFGAGDGSTTFELPDMRGEFPRGWDDGRGVDSGRAFGTAQLDQMQRITGGFRMERVRSTDFYDEKYTGAFADSGQVNAQASGDGSIQPLPDIRLDSSFSPDARTSATTDGETRPRNVALLACIKF